MSERTNIPSSPECGRWETLLADALDGLLTPAEQAGFEAHMVTCAGCSVLYEDSKRGLQWLEFLSPEPEVPAGLLDKILAQTGPGQVAGFGLVPAGDTILPAPQPWQRPGFMGQVRRFAEPRLFMTAAMAFFSIALTLNLTNVRLSSLRLADLRPTSIRSFVERRVNMASTPVIRYYDHLRFVYEVQTRVRELRRNTDDAQQQPDAPGQSRQDPSHKDGGSHLDPSWQDQQGQPEQSVRPTFNEVNDNETTDLLESSLTSPDHTSADLTRARHRQPKPGNAAGSLEEVRDSAAGDLAVRRRSTSWTA